MAPPYEVRMLNVTLSGERSLLGIFAKYWQPGAVKTRLAQSIGADQASQLYRQFLQTMIHRFSRVADERMLCYWPPQRHQEFAAAGGRLWQLSQQSDGDLGRRMREFFVQARSEGYARTVLIGSDSPTLPADYLDQAFARLESDPVVLGPSGDGGYYLIGVSGKEPPIFDGIAWSTNSVWDQTVDRLRRAEIPFAELPAWYDVDDLEDLRQLHRNLEELCLEDSQWHAVLLAVEAVLEII